jgi:hypothetical protein
MQRTFLRGEHYFQTPRFIRSKKPITTISELVNEFAGIDVTEDAFTAFRRPTLNSGDGIGGGKRRCRIGIDITFRAEAEK